MKTKIGIYNLHMQAKGGGEKRTLVLAEHLSRSSSVLVFVNEAFDVRSMESYFDVDLSRVQFVVLGKDHRSQRQRLLSAKRDEWSSSFGHFLRIKSFNLDLFVNNSHCSSLPSPTRRGIYMCMFPHTHPAAAMSPNLAQRAYRSLMNRLEERVLGCRFCDFISSYSTVTANSHFTAQWIERRWACNAEVIYSACDKMGPPVADKQKTILNVGRFLASAAGGLLKRQEVLLDVFAGLADIQKAGWQLHFAGSVTPDAKTRELIDRLVHAARGLPVFFHFDTDRDTLRTLYRSASLYWHATGYGLPTGEYPSAQEHFGMTTVEAMSAGAVPLVINAGGQKEIVSHEVDGLLWNDLDTLAQQTGRLIADSVLRERLSQQAISTSARFGRADYNQRMSAIIERVMSAELPVQPARHRH
jgi:glycosyltransferase involved in cell wall biosynthesis